LLTDVEVFFPQQNEKYEQMQMSNKIKCDELNYIKALQQQILSELEFPAPEHLLLRPQDELIKFRRTKVPNPLFRSVQILKS
jgi:hypothetical protein